MSGVVENYQYDSVSTIDYNIVLLRSTPEDPGFLVRVHAQHQNTYLLGTHGDWYDGATLTTFTNDKGYVIRETITDNAAHNQWYTAHTIVYNSSHAISGADQGSYESIVVSKDGMLYTNDYNSAGTEIATLILNSDRSIYYRSNWSTNQPMSDPLTPEEANVIQNIPGIQEENALWNIEYKQTHPNPNSYLMSSVAEVKHSVIQDMTGIEPKGNHNNMKTYSESFGAINNNYNNESLSAVSLSYNFLEKSVDHHSSALILGDMH